MKSDSINFNTEMYFKQIEKKLLSLPEITDNIDEGKFIKDKTRLSKTNEEARMKARLDSVAVGENFDETKTPQKELDALDNTIVDWVAQRDLNYITED